jgi:protein phosphatase
MIEITLPARALVVLIGVSGAGKSTFAARHFPATAILSSDAFRAMVADDEADQAASRAAFELLHLVARRRLERGRLTVIDATSVTRAARLGLVSIARRTDRPAVAIVLDPPLAVCLERNAARPGRRVDPAVVARQAAQLAASLADPEPFATEGFAAVHRIPDPETVRIIIVAHTPGTLEGMPARRSTDRRTAR